jgi:hypothetical protein
LLEPVLLQDLHCFGDQVVILDANHFLGRDIASQTDLRAAEGIKDTKRLLDELVARIQFPILNLRYSRLAYSKIRSKFPLAQSQPSTPLLDFFYRW